MNSVKILPCPFCGRQVDIEDGDTLYPSGTVWRYDEELEMRTYHRLSDRKEGDTFCFELNCTVSSGGCGAEIHADTKDETIAAWNRRT